VLRKLLDSLGIDVDYELLNEDIFIMKRFISFDRSKAVAWGLAVVLSFSVGFFAVSVPGAYAQAASSSQDESRRYSQLLQTIYQFILQNYVEEVDPSTLYQGAMKGMLNALGDPHSTFLDVDMLSDLMRETDGKYAGVGLYISKMPGLPGDGAEKFVEVVSPIEDTPGWKAGVMPGDLILKIDGESTADLTVDQASAKIRGPAGSKVKLSFRRGNAYEFELEFTRAIIEIPAIKTAVIPTEKGKIGYIRIIEWMPQTSDRMDEAIKKLVSEKIDTFIVDVRSNPGGLLSSVIQVSDLFLDSGVIVSTRGRNPQENSVYTANASKSLPVSARLVVLINRGSASASEIFAGAMKDTKRAVLVGEKSYGKGSVQQIFPIDKTGFKLTMSRYYTPSGVNIDKTGIDPDILVPDVVLTDQQFESLEKLYNTGLIQEFAKNNPSASILARNEYADLLRAKGFDLPVEYLSRLLRNEVERTQASRVYDIEFDTQLLRAIETIQNPGFEDLLLKSKTLSQKISSK
jgi:carboxyl-terminal processing protease